MNLKTEIEAFWRRVKSEGNGLRPVFEGMKTIPWEYKMMRKSAGYSRLEAARWSLWPLRAFICILIGHDEVDEGYGNPECGCIEIRCQRCDYCWPTHWLY